MTVPADAPPITDEQAAIYVDEINQASLRIVSLVKQHSPTCDNAVLVNALAVAVGQMVAAETWPYLPTPQRFSGLGHMMAIGVSKGRQALTETEKQSCRGSA